MNRDRRRFVTTTATLAAAQLAGVGLANAQVRRDAGAPVTGDTIDAMGAQRRGARMFTCVRTPESNDGPYYYSSSPRRGAIAEGRSGVQLKLLQKESTVGQTFMRGHQITDASGQVEFDSVIPGWEIGRNVARATHVHVKVFHENKVVTAQLYFPNEFLDELYANVDPYRTH